MFGTDAGVVQTGGNRIRGNDLTVRVLQQVAQRAVQHAGPPESERGRVFQAQSFTGGFDADFLNGSVILEGVEGSHRIASSAHTGDDVTDRGIGETLDLLFNFLPDDGLEIADNHRIGMGADDRADDVVGISDVGDPVADRLAGGVLQGAGAARDGNDFGAEQPHAKNIQRLAFHVFFSHEHAAF